MSSIEDKVDWLYQLYKCGKFMDVPNYAVAILSMKDFIKFKEGKWQLTPEGKAYLIRYCDEDVDNLKMESKTRRNRNFYPFRKPNRRIDYVSM